MKDDAHLKPRPHPALGSSVWSVTDGALASRPGVAGVIG